MLTRVLIVMLAVLNLGVALWWWLRPQAVPSLPTLAADVAVLELLPPSAQPPAHWADTASTQAESATRLQNELLDEDELEEQADENANKEELAPDTDNALVVASHDGTENEVESEAAITLIEVETAEIAQTESTLPDIAAIVPVEETPPQAPNEPEPAMQPCVSLGPYSEMAQVQAALRALGGDVERFRLREVVVPADTRYRIFIPPAPSREQAQAEVERIAAAGFSDYFIINEGEDTHAIALGQFRNQQGAQNRLAQLKAAGFAAQLLTTTEVPHSNWWIDTAPAARITPEMLQQRSNAAQWQTLDCARLR